MAASSALALGHTPLPTRAEWSGAAA